ncbi:MAG: ABC transporter permease [Bacteroidetes bacterium]|nr:ABC transporter permease [Bacteroidota bacterium]
MLKKIIISFLLAVQNIRSHFFHTILSLLGIVIGVAALVAILSMIDGMEKFAHEQIASTTSLNMISVTTDQYTEKDGVAFRKDSATVLLPQDFDALKKTLKYPATIQLFQRQSKKIKIVNDTATVGAFSTGIMGLNADTIRTGLLFTDEDLLQRKPVAVVNDALAKILAGYNKKNILRRVLKIDTTHLTIIGVVSMKHSKAPEVFFPITVLPNQYLNANPPVCLIEAIHVEDVASIKKDVGQFLSSRFSDKHDFLVSTNEFRVEQAANGFRLFRVIMGMIVGISVLVGGIGVMNVLLISVTERTSEIGVRKAVGANRRDIILQFLSESITISFFGSLLGLILGILGTMLVIPIVKALTKIPFQAAYTWNTITVVSILALIVGIVFGTYPAMRASKLDPVEAIRRE